MPIAIALEDVRGSGVRRDIEGGALQRTNFIESTEAGAPQAFMVEYDPNRVSRAHFHAVDQFQIVVGGKGRIGRHELTPYSVHFARAFTPYGPLVASAEGMTFLTLRWNLDAGAQRLPEAKTKLQLVRGRNPWQITCDTYFDPQARPGSGVLVEPVAAIRDDRGLATYRIDMAPNATAYAPDPSRGTGQFIVVLEGSLEHDGKELSGVAIVSVDPTESAYALHAGAQGLKGLVVSFPRGQAQPQAATAAESGTKTWQCVLCAFVYDESAGLPEEGIAPGTPWQDVPENWSCPDCAATKRDFQMIEL